YLSFLSLLYSGKQGMGSRHFFISHLPLGNYLIKKCVLLLSFKKFIISMKRGVLKMDSLDIFFSVINHPIKITILKFMEENEHMGISFTDLMEFFLIDHLSIERVVLITNIWEMYNDHLLRK